MKTSRIIVCAVGFAAGVLVGQQLFRGQQRTEGPQETVAREVGAAPANQGSGSRNPKRNLDAILKWRSRQGLSFNPAVERELERLDGGALRALIQEMMAVFGDHPGPDTRASREILVMAAMELYRRDGEAALEWASTMTGDRELVMTWMLGPAARESPELAKRWIERMNGEFHKQWELSVVHHAVAGATERGADDLIRLRESYGELLKGSAFPAGSYPPDFDFAKLVAALGTEVPLNDAVRYWAATDRDAAWLSVKGLIDGKGKGTAYVGSLYAGTAAVLGERAAAEWLLPKLGALPENERLEAIAALPARGGMTREGVEAVMAALPREVEREALARQLVSTHTTGGQDLAALRGLACDTSRLDVLLAAAEPYSQAMGKAPPRHVKAIRGYFGKTMSEIGLPGELREQVMERLDPGRK